MYIKRIIDILLLALIATLLLIPIIVLVLYSLQTFSAIQSGNFNGWNFDNYLSVMDGFFTSLLFTTLIIFLSSMFTILISITASFSMSQLEIPFKKFFSMLIIIPILIPSSTIVATEYKLINSLGMASGAFSYAIGLSLPFAYSYLSYAILKSGYDGIDPHLKEKAYTDGISGWNYFVLTLGNIKSEIIWVVLMTCISCWNSYLYPRIILMGTDLRVITLWLYDVSIDSVDYINHPELQAAASIISSIPLIIFFIIFRDRLMNKIKSV